MKTLSIKNIFLQLFLVLTFLLTNNVIAQEDEYKQAIILLKEQINNPDLSPEIKDILKTTLAQTQELMDEIESEDKPPIIYSEYEPRINTETEKENDRRNKMESLPPTPTPLTPAKNNGKTMISSMAN